jgi:hypothetical protein
LGIFLFHARGAGGYLAHEIFEDIKPKLPRRYFGLPDAGNTLHLFLRWEGSISELSTVLAAELQERSGDRGVAHYALVELGQRAWSIERDDNGDISRECVDDWFDPGGWGSPQLKTRLDDLSGWMNSNNSGTASRPRFGPKGLLVVTREPLEDDERLRDSIRAQLGVSAGGHWPGTHSLFFTFSSDVDPPALADPRMPLGKLLTRRSLCCAAIVEIGPNYVSNLGSMDPFRAALARLAEERRQTRAVFSPISQSARQSVPARVPVVVVRNRVRGSSAPPPPQGRPPASPAKAVDD